MSCFSCCRSSRKPSARISASGNGKGLRRQKREASNSGGRESRKPATWQAASKRCETARCRYVPPPNDADFPLPRYAAGQANSRRHPKCIYEIVALSRRGFGSRLPLRLGNSGLLEDRNQSALRQRCVPVMRDNGTPPRLRMKPAPVRADAMTSDKAVCAKIRLDLPRVERLHASAAARRLRSIRRRSLRR